MRTAIRRQLDALKRSLIETEIVGRRWRVKKTGHAFTVLGLGDRGGVEVREANGCARWVDADLIYDSYVEKTIEEEPA